MTLIIAKQKLQTSENFTVLAITRSRMRSTGWCVQHLLVILTVDSIIGLMKMTSIELYRNRNLRLAEMWMHALKMAATMSLFLAATDTYCMHSDTNKYLDGKPKTIISLLIPIILWVHRQSWWTVSYQWTNKFNVVTQYMRVVWKFPA